MVQESILPWGGSDNYTITGLLNQSINQHHKNVKIPSPGGCSVYTNKTESVLSLSVQEYMFAYMQGVIIITVLSSSLH